MTAIAQTVLSRRFDWEPTETPYQQWQHGGTLEPPQKADPAMKSTSVD